MFGKWIAVFMAPLYNYNKDVFRGRGGWNEQHTYLVIDLKSFMLLWSARSVGWTP